MGLLNDSLKPHLALSACLLVGCQEAAPSDGPLVAQRVERDDAVVVRVISGSAWGRKAHLSEELRLGALEGEGPEVFGDIVHVAVGAGGEMYVFDDQVPSILRFGPSGDFLGVVGREGSGPGEYGSRPTGMIVAAGELLLADPRNARISAFDLSGNYLGSRGSVTGLRSTFSRGLAPFDDGSFAVPVLTVDAGPGVKLPTPWPIGLEIHRADGGIQDTIPPQMLAGRPAGAMAATPTGAILVAADSSFVFELRSSEAEVLRVEMPFERVNFTEGELRQLGRALGAAAQADGGGASRAPKFKEPYLEFLFAPDGRILARRPIADSGSDDATWSNPRYQPSILDVFDPAGTFLGVIPLPKASRPMVVTETHLYLLELGDFDEQYLVRYRVEAGGVG